MRKVCHPPIQAIKDVCGIDDGGPSLLTLLPAVGHKHARSARCSARELACPARAGEVQRRLTTRQELYWKVGCGRAAHEPAHRCMGKLLMKRLRTALCQQPGRCCVVLAAFHN